MTRNRTSARKAGSTLERAVADYLANTLGNDVIDRRVKHGANDRGDIHGVKTLRGGRVVLECKDYGGTYNVGPWLNEAEIERGNDDALISAVVAKRRGKGDPADQVVFMTLRDFAYLLNGGLEPMSHVFKDDKTAMAGE